MLLQLLADENFFVMHPQKIHFILKYSGIAFCQRPDRN